MTLSCWCEICVWSIFCPCSKWFLVAKECKHHESVLLSSESQCICFRLRLQCWVCVFHWHGEMSNRPAMLMWCLNLMPSCGRRHSTKKSWWTVLWKSCFTKCLFCDWPADRNPLGTTMMYKYKIYKINWVKKDQLSEKYSDQKAPSVPSWRLAKGRCRFL